MKKPKGLDSGMKIKGDDKKFSELTAAARIETICEMVKRVEKCPTCGHETEVGFMSPEDARKLLGLK